jgi:hypothetical protein
MLGAGPEVAVGFARARDAGADAAVLEGNTLDACGAGLAKPVTSSGRSPWVVTPLRRHVSWASVCRGLRSGSNRSGAVRFEGHVRAVLAFRAALARVDARPAVDHLAVDPELGTFVRDGGEVDGLFFGQQDRAHVPRGEIVVGPEGVDHAADAGPGTEVGALRRRIFGGHAFGVIEAGRSCVQRSAG